MQYVLVLGRLRPQADRTTQTLRCWQYVCSCLELLPGAMFRRFQISFGSATLRAHRIDRSLIEVPASRPRTESFEVATVGIGALCAPRLFRGLLFGRFSLAAWRGVAHTRHSTHARTHARARAHAPTHARTHARARTNAKTG